MLKSKLLSLFLIFCIGLLFTSVGATEKGSDKTEVKESTPTTVETTKTVKEQMDDLLSKLKESGVLASDGSRTGEQINWQVISGGATNGSSTNYSLMGTVGQTAVGVGSSTSYTVNHGYWQDFSGGTCCNLAGDFNDDGSVDVSDLTAMVDFMFGGGPAAPCPDEADVDASCGIDISDLTFRVDWMFGGGAPPVCGCVGS